MVHLSAASELSGLCIVTYREQSRCKMHTLETSDFLSQCLQLLTTFWVSRKGLKPKRSGFREQFCNMLSRVYKVLSALTRKHAGSDFLLMAVCLPSSFHVLASSLLQTPLCFHRAGWVSTMNSSVCPGLDHAIVARVPFPLPQQHANKVPGQDWHPCPHDLT